MSQTETHLPQAADSDPTYLSLPQWRARAARITLIALATFGLPAWGAVVFNAWRAQAMTPLVWTYVAIYAAILALALIPSASPRLRIWGLLVLGYSNGCLSLLRLGLDGSGRLYLLALPIFATVLVGTRAGLATAFLSAATYFLFAAQVGAAQAALWLEAGVALAAFMLVTVVLLGRFSRLQSRTLNRERRARKQLEAARAQLAEYSATLEDKVRERTAELAQATQVAEAASRRFEEELLFAGRIQAGFMASELPQIPAWQQAAALVPARETSGDFYNIFPLPGDRYGILIADVVDKGVGAALFMALCWALLHTYARRFPDDPARVLAAVNRRILRDTHAGQFVTVFYGVLCPQTGELTYASAGHPPPFRLREGRMHPLTKTGMPLGILEDEQWQQRAIVFRPGDLCLLYTDGVTEAQNAGGDFYDVQRLAATLRRSAGRSAAQIRRAVLEDLARFTGDVAQADDITLVVLTRERATEAEAPDEVQSDAESVHRLPDPAGANPPNTRKDLTGLGNRSGLSLHQVVSLREWDRQRR